MITKIKELNIPLQDLLARINREVNLFDEIYYQPKTAGVVNLFVPRLSKDILHDRLDYLHSNVDELQDPRITDESIKLILRIQQMGLIMGFDIRGVANQEGYSEKIDLSAQIPAKDEIPFFSWEPSSSLIHKITVLKKIDETEWMERSTKAIGDLRSKTRYRLPDNGKLYTTRPNAMQTHGLSFQTTNVQEGIDTKLSFDCGWGYVEGFMYDLSFHLREGVLIKVTDGGGESDFHQALERIQTTMNVSPQQIKYYIEHSNLTDAHKGQIADVIDGLSSFPEIGVYDLFDAQRRPGYLVNKISKFLSKGRITVNPSKDDSKIDLSKLQTQFGTVIINNPSVEELANTGFSDENLSYIQVSFQHQTGKEYVLSYNPEITGSLGTLKSKGHVNAMDFLNVEEIIKQQLNLGFSREIEKGPNFIHRHYELKFAPTQQFISDIVNQIIIPNFQNVQINCVEFKDVYEHTVTASPLDKGKIATKDVNLVP
jgi:hypothetical protein